jgi:hypothetical protein
MGGQLVTPTGRQARAGAERTAPVAVAAMQSEEAAEAMAHDGVVPESLVILIEE